MNVAAFCDQAIEDKNGVITLVRIVDQITVSASGTGVSEELPEGAGLNTTLVIGLKAVEARGEADRSGPD